MRKVLVWGHKEISLINRHDQETEDDEIQEVGAYTQFYQDSHAKSVFNI